MKNKNAEVEKEWHKMLVRESNKGTRALLCRVY